jgi:hypothetical protein
VGLSEHEKAEFPDHLQGEFGERRFEREDPRLLDFAGAEFILVGARSNPEGAYGVELPTEHEADIRADIIRELHLEKSRHPVKPLFEGKWQ